MPLQPAALSGFASLDVMLPLPTDREPVMFETPRGQIAITAQPVSKDLLHRLTSLVIVALLVAAGVIAYRLGCRLLLRQAASTMTFAILLILIGLLVWLLDVLPWFAIALFVVGLLLALARLFGLSRIRRVTTPARPY
jgi:membrane-bound ClpP family serine protease